MIQTTVIIPNYNGIRYLEACLTALLGELRQTPFHILVVDNGSTDGSEQAAQKAAQQMLRRGEGWKDRPGQERERPRLRQIRLKNNTGFAGAVNVGIEAAETPYVLLLNNDTLVRPGFVRQMTRAIERDGKLFSVSAKMLSMRDPKKVDDAGDWYSALGWAFARGKGKRADAYDRPARVFAACGGAAIYRRALLLELGGFDWLHFAYLEDIDVGYRALLAGYRNGYEPSAEVLHAGSGTTGSAHNPLKVTLSARNSVYLAYKNMPALQLLLNAPFLLCGHLIKLIYFARKRLAGAYLNGLRQGAALCLSREGRKRKVRFRLAALPRYVRIQGALLAGIVRRLL